MSGGSYGYLYERTVDGDIGYAGAYREIAKDSHVEKYPDVRGALLKLAEEREALGKKHDALASLMHAIEWTASGDWSPEQLEEVVFTWRKKK